MSTPIGQDRQPRRGDIIQAAPFFPNGCSGVVVGVTQGRITFDSPEHGRLQLPLARFTWKTKARVWICWPPGLAKHMKAIIACDEAHQRARYGIIPNVGDCVSVAGKTGWIAKKTAARIQASAAEGALFNATFIYEISLIGGNIFVEGERVAFDPDLRIWTTAPA